MATYVGNLQTLSMGVQPYNPVSFNEVIDSSGDQITTFNHFSGISIANGQVYISAYDGMLYCFGLKK